MKWSSSKISGGVVVILVSTNPRASHQLHSTPQSQHRENKHNRRDLEHTLYTFGSLASGDHVWDEGIGQMALSASD